MLALTVKLLALFFIQLLTFDETVLSLGDSYTIGEGVKPEERWSVQMVAALKQSGLGVTAPQIIAKTGWTTDELHAGIAASEVAEQYDWVTLLIGVNNQYRNRDPEEFRQQLRELLEFSIKKARENPKRVIVLSIPDWGVTPFAEGRDRQKIAKQIDLFNQVVQEESERLQAHFIDITDISREAADRPQELLAPDNLHPSAAMYKRWAERAAKVISDTAKSTKDSR